MYGQNCSNLKCLIKANLGYHHPASLNNDNIKPFSNYSPLFGCFLPDFIQILAQRELNNLSIQLCEPSYLHAYPSSILKGFKGTLSSCSKYSALSKVSTRPILKIAIYTLHSKVHQKTWPTLRGIYVQETKYFCFLSCSSQLSILPFQENNLCNQKNETQLWDSTPC